MTKEEKTIYEGLIHISNKVAVAKRALVYIGVTDCALVAPGAKLFQYNVMAKNHPKYKSTVGYKHGW